jgi:hypothetical protein
MHDIVMMDVVDGLEDLEHQMLEIVGRLESYFLDKLQEVHFQAFHHQEDGVICLEQALHPADTVMGQFSHHRIFLYHTFLPLTIDVVHMSRFVFPSAEWSPLLHHPKACKLP